MRRRSAWLLISLLAPGVAQAEDGSPRAQALNTVLFGSLDAGRSAFASVGFKRALGSSLDRDGFILMGGGGFGGSPERGSGFSRLDRFTPSAQGYALAGYQWMLGRAVIAALVGPELDSENESSATGPGARTRLGLRSHAELWAHPTPETLATATFIAGSARGHVWSRVSAGYAAWEHVFIGPEATFFARDDYREWRVGAHATGLTLGRFTLRLSGGYVQANDGRSGGYGALSAYVRL
jgi:hypothetical protein